jgi:peptide alpha-N-acetyltransferase
MQSFDEKKIEFQEYSNESQLPHIVSLIENDLSEPYCIYTYRYFLHNYPKYTTLALDEGKIVGVIIAKCDFKKNDSKWGYIAMLAVHKDYRNHRIGTTLAKFVIEKMINDSAKVITLETEITNEGAIKLYKKLGFLKDKRLQRYYLNGVDAFRLKLCLE